MRRAVALSILLSTLACRSGGGDLDYGDCPAGYLSECATLQVPLDHDGRASGSIGLHVARHPAKDSARKQVWLLSGGPGQAGSVFEGLVRALHDALPDADVYVVDHRGTGYSHRLACPESEQHASTPTNLLEGCMAELDRKGDKEKLAYFTVTQAAKDVVAAIEATRSPDQEVLIWGASYGTVWAHRIMQVAPHGLIQAIVFDGFVTPGEDTSVDSDRRVDEVGKRLLQLCTEDADCREHIGSDPEAVLRGLYAQLASTSCQGIDAGAARVLLGRMIDEGLFQLVFPTIVRLSRCSGLDQNDLAHLKREFDKFLQGRSVSLDSTVLYLNIELSERWARAGAPERSPEDYQAQLDAQLFCFDSKSFPASFAAVRHLWALPPAEAPPPIPAQNRDIAMLWLAGSLDTRTPLEQAKHITNYYPAASFVTIPNARHTPSYNEVGGPLVLEFLRTKRVGKVAGKLSLAFTENLQAGAPSSWWGTRDRWGAGDPKLRDATGK